MKDNFLDHNKGRELIRFETIYSAVIDPKEIMIENLGEENDDDYVDENGSRYINTDNLSAKQVIDLIQDFKNDIYFDWMNTPTEFAEENNISLKVEPEKSVKHYLKDSLVTFKN